MPIVRSLHSECIALLALTQRSLAGRNPPYLTQQSGYGERPEYHEDQCANAEMGVKLLAKFMSTLLQEIEAQISGAKLATAKQNVGTVREIGDGVAKIEGLTDAKIGRAHV